MQKLKMGRLNLKTPMEKEYAFVRFLRTQHISKDSLGITGFEIFHYLDFLKGRTRGFKSCYTLEFF